MSKTSKTNIKDSQKKPPQMVLEKSKLDITMIKLKEYANLYKGRKQGEALNKEKTLLLMIQSPQRSKQDEQLKFKQLVSDLNTIECYDNVIRYCEILKERSVQIQNSRGQVEQIADIMPMLSSLTYAANFLGDFKDLQEAKQLLNAYFGKDITAPPLDLGLDPTLLQQCQQVTLTTPRLHQYVLDFCQKYSITPAEFNRAGHNFNFPLQQQLPPQQYPQQQMHSLSIQQQQQQYYYQQPQQPIYQPQMYPAFNGVAPPANNNFVQLPQISPIKPQQSEHQPQPPQPKQQSSSFQQPQQPVQTPQQPYFQPINNDNPFDAIPKQDFVPLPVLVPQQPSQPVQPLQPQQPVKPQQSSEQPQQPPSNQQPQQPSQVPISESPVMKQSIQAPAYVPFSHDERSLSVLRDFFEEQRTGKAILTRQEVAWPQMSKIVNGL